MNSKDYSALAKYKTEPLSKKELMKIAIHHGLTLQQALIKVRQSVEDSDPWKVGKFVLDKFDLIIECGITVKIDSHHVILYRTDGKIFWYSHTVNKEIITKIKYKVENPNEEFAQML